MKRFKLQPLAAAAVLLCSGPAGAAAFNEFQLGEDVEIKLGGRVQYDTLFDSDAPKSQQDDGEFRRVRAGFSARYTRDWVFTASGDFVDKPRLRDLSLEYRGFPVRIEVGRFQEPFGLAENGSSRHTLFMERPSPTAFGPDYGLGGALNYRGERWGLSVGGFAADDSPNFGGDRNESAVTGRVTVNPLRGDVLLHLGGSYSQRKSDDPDGIRFSGTPETVLVSGYTPRGLRDPLEDKYSLAGAEAALRLGPVLAQGEFIRISSDGLVEGEGWYGEIGWVLTGERRDYGTRYGNFDGVNPKRPLNKGGIGAIEIGLRYSETDFSEDGGDLGEVVGIALNWYPFELLRLSVNAQRISLEEPGVPKEEADVIQGRAQLYF